MDLKELIAKHREQVENPTPKLDTVNVVVAGQLVKVTVAKLLGRDWRAVAAFHPPRSGTDDRGLGVNLDTLPADYPADKITVEGEPVDKETWQELYGLLASVHRQNVATVMWGLNVLEDITELRELGKAQTGDAKTSSSPANRASRRAGSKGGNPPRSRSTTTTKTAE